MCNGVQCPCLMRGDGWDSANLRREKDQTTTWAAAPAAEISRRELVVKWTTTMTVFEQEVAVDGTDLQQPKRIQGRVVSLIKAIQTHPKTRGYQRLQPRLQEAQVRPPKNGR